MKLCKGKIVELDPKKWYWLILNQYEISPDEIEDLRMENGRVLFVSDINSIEFVENPDRIKGIIVKEF